MLELIFISNDLVNGLPLFLRIEDILDGFPLVLIAVGDFEECPGFELIRNFLLVFLCNDRQLLS